MNAREIVYTPDESLPQELRCFFCYARFETQEILSQFDNHKVYHLTCLPDMLSANEIEMLTLIQRDGSQKVIAGFTPRSQKPY